VRQASDAKAVIEQLKALNKEELLALIFSNAWWVWRIDLQLRDINQAKGKVIRAKADAAFAKYQEISQQRREGSPHDATTVKGQIAFWTRAKEAETWFKRYMQLSNKADKLEFGHLDLDLKKGVTHDAK
jgi:hypothetical protein